MWPPCCFHGALGCLYLFWVGRTRPAGTVRPCAGTSERVFRRPRVAEPELLEEIDQSPRQTHEVGSEHGVIEVCDQWVCDGAADGA